MRASRFAASGAALLLGASALGWRGSARAERTIHSFSTKTLPGLELAPDRAGNLYGVTAGFAGSSCSRTSCGTIFRLVPPAAKGQAWTAQTLYTFPASGANGPNGVVYAALGGQLALDSAGNIYGTCFAGGNAGEGTAWRLSPPSVKGGAWTMTVLHSFTGGVDGGAPASGLVIDRSGTLYGTTSEGGRSGGNGVVFSLSPPPSGGTAWTETVLHTFAARNDANYLFDPLTLSAHGTILDGVSRGSISKRGRPGNGAVFRLRRQGNSWTYHLLYQFPGLPGQRSLPAGALPTGPVVVDRNNNIFGTASSGGTAREGVVFELSPPAPGQSNWTEQVIYNFDGSAGGEYPIAGLIAGGSPPALFGATGYSTGTAVDGSTGHDGEIFRLDPPASGTGSWSYTALHAFAGRGHPVNGYPGPLTFGLHRFLFGVTTTGGPDHRGFVYVLSPHIPASSPAVR